MRVVFLGDSLVWGRYGGDFVGVVGEQMPEHSVMNAGVGGDTVVNLLRRVADVIERHAPDAIVISVGGNDAVSYGMPATRPYYERTKGIEGGMVSPDDFSQAYWDLLTHIQLAYVQPIVMLSPTEYNAELVALKRTYNERALEVAQSLNVDVIALAEHFYPSEPIERAPVDMGFIMEIGKKHQSGWQDYEDERAKWGYTYTFDGMHLLPETADAFAKIIVPELRGVLG